MENGTFTSKEDVPYALVLDLPGSEPLTEDIWFVDAIVLWIRSLETQTLVGIGMIAISMITILGAKIFGRNGEPVEEPVEVVEEPIEEVVLPRGLFSQVIEKTMSFFGH